MLKVIATFIVKMNRFDDFIETAKSLVALSREEKGCLKYELYRESQNTQMLTIIEEWEDKNSLEAHMKSKHFNTMIPLIEQCVSEKIKINIYEKLI